MNVDNTVVSDPVVDDKNEKRYITFAVNVALRIKMTKNVYPWCIQKEWSMKRPMNINSWDHNKWIENNEKIWGAVEA